MTVGHSVSHRTQFQDPETEIAEWNSLVTDLIIYTLPVLLLL